MHSSASLPAVFSSRLIAGPKQFEDIKAEKFFLLQQQPRQLPRADVFLYISRLTFPQCRLELTVQIASMSQIVLAETRKVCRFAERMPSAGFLSASFSLTFASAHTISCRTSTWQSRMEVFFRTEQKELLDTRMSAIHLRMGKLFVHGNEIFSPTLTVRREGKKISLQRETVRNNFSRAFADAGWREKIN